MRLRVHDVVRILEELVNLPYYYPVGVTHDYLVIYSRIGGDTEVRSLNLRSGESVTLARGRVVDVAVPSPKSREVVVAIDVSEGRELAKLFVVDVAGGELRELCDAPPGRVMGVAFNGEKVAYSVSYRDRVSIMVSDLRGSWEEVVKGKEIMMVTDFSDDLVVGHGVLKGNPKSMELFTLDVRTSEFKVVTPKEGSVNRLPKVREGKVLFNSNAYGGNELLVYDASSDSFERLSLSGEDFRRYDIKDYGPFGWLRDGRAWFVGLVKGRSKLFIDGYEVKVPEGSIDGVAVGEDALYVSHSSLKTPYRILKVWLSKEPEVVVNNELPEDIAKALGEVRFVEYESFDGLKIPTYVVESRAAEKPGPTVIYVHGGPWSEVADRWNVMIASLATCGYHVVAPNFRGSRGYGEDFRLKDIGDPGGGDLMDVVKARDYAVETRLASRVAIMGYSYGGFMTYLATTKYPDLWDAGVAGAGVTDWEEMYELSDEVFKRFIEVLFAGKKELLRDRSPINYVERVKAPLCIIHPQNDSRTPLKPVLRFISKLLELGKTFEAHIIPDMGHYIRTSEDAMKILLPALMFLNKYLRLGSHDG